MPSTGERELHQRRTMAESFGSDPERYDRSRPQYPNAMVERVVAACPGTDVLDVGCGTGIAARQFQAAGCHVLGVDPDARMAEWAHRRGLTTEVSTFESWDADGRTFDAVVDGQSWHWVDPAAGAAKAAAVLRPGGRLAVFRNDPRLPGELSDAVAEATRRVVPTELADRLRARPDGPGSATLSTKAADGIRRADGFDEPEEWQFDWQRPYTRDEYLDELPTAGFYTQLAPDKLAPLLAEVGAGIDAVGGSFVANYTTTVVTAARARH